MVRSGSATGRHTPRLRAAATILFAGPMGTGVGIAADIAADVARLSHRAVVRRRDFSPATASADCHLPHATAKPIVLQIVSFSDATQAADPTRIDIAIAWDHASAAAIRAAGLEAGETIIVDHDSLAPDTVPTWRRDLLSDAAASSGSANDVRSNAGALQRTARALKALSRRLPFTRELWERVVKLHVPARRRRAATSEFSR